MNVCTFCNIINRYIFNLYFYAHNQLCTFIQDHCGIMSNAEELEYIRGSEDEDMDEDDGEVEHKTYLPGDTIADDEELICDQTAYVLYHAAQTGMCMLR